MKKILENLAEKTKWLRSAFITVLLIAIIVVIYFGLNLWVESLELTDIDLTQEKLYSLSQETKDKINNITQDITINLYGMDSAIVDYAKLYEKQNSHIHCVDLTENIASRPDLQQEYGLGNSTTEAIVIEAGTRKKILTYTDLYSYDYTTYEQIDITEQAITNAIIDVNLEKNPKIYMMTNHVKYAGRYQILTEYLKNEANEVEDIDLLVSGAVPEDCDVLVITELKEDITAYEKDLIVNYINQGGNLLIMEGPNVSGLDLTNFQAVLDVYGVKISTGIVYEESSTRTINGYANIMLPNVNASNEITKYIATDGTIALIDSGAIEYQSDEQLETLGVTVENLVTASDTAFMRTDHTQTSVIKTDKDEDASNKPLAASISKKINDTQSSELIIFAGSVFASDLMINLNGNSQANSVVGIGFYNNKDIVINAVSYLTERKDNITIRKDTGMVTYTATQAEHQIIQAIITALPVLVIVIGIIIWQVRRRKK